MATLGLLSPEFPSGSLSANLDAIAATGAVSVQFDLASAVGHTFPTELSQDTVEAVKVAFFERELKLAALSGTYNMIDPDPQVRQTGAEGLNRVIALAPRLGTNVVTLCTGSRDPSNMWRKHPDNDTPEAWADLLVQMEEAVRVAEKYGITLGVEPEIGNALTPYTKLDGFSTRSGRRG